MTPFLLVAPLVLYIATEEADARFLFWYPLLVPRRRVSLAV